MHAAQAADKGDHTQNHSQQGFMGSMSTFRYQSTALLKKRLLTFKRDKKMWIFGVFMPFLFVGAGTLTVLSFELEDQPALALSPQVHICIQPVTMSTSHLSLTSTLRFNSTSVCFLVCIAGIAAK